MYGRPKKLIFKPSAVDEIEYKSGFNPKKSGSHKRVMAILILITLILGITLIWSFGKSSTSVFSFAISNVKTKEPEKERVNVLMLGLAGGKHDGALLTDSIILASLNIKQKHAQLFSIPRDLWVDSSKAKVNAIYEKNIKEEDGGLKKTKEEMGKLLGVPIDYTVKLDFNGFAKAVDLVGGVDLEITNSFDDYEYPVEGKEKDLCGMSEKEVELDEAQAKVLGLAPGKNKVITNKDGKIATTSADFFCRFEHIRFEKGTIHLTGVQALKFVRSRKGTNGEGSDFARSKRQQRVIESFRQKALSFPTWSNPQTIIDLITTLRSSIDLDIPADQFLYFYTLVKNIEKTESIVLGDLGKGVSLFINPPVADYGGAWVLVPRNNDYGKISEFVQNKLAGISSESTASATIK